MTAKARRFLTTLVNSATISEAIRTTGVAEATAYRWLRDEDFKAELRQARREALTAATTKLTAATGTAVDVLTAIMSDTEAPDSTRVQAARTLLSVAYDAVQADDLAERIEKLEQMNKDQQTI
ncbi:hypothetical protein [Oenococcus oeni]|uniref:hypothetical protein n=2 Tax=Oenococcus oeni TaxID=1247 RepID=UPI000AFC0492|nr:hypothetical protein [Oenococcus oeni]